MTGEKVYRLVHARRRTCGQRCIRRGGGGGLKGERGLAGSQPQTLEEGGGTVQGGGGVPALFLRCTYGRSNTSLPVGHASGLQTARAWAGVSLREAFYAPHARDCGGWLCTVAAPMGPRLPPAAVDVRRRMTRRYAPRPGRVRCVVARHFSLQKLKREVGGG